MAYHMHCQSLRAGSNIQHRSPREGALMALDAETAASGLIRTVQKALGKESQAALLAPLLYARNGLSGLESLPADWLAANAREAFAFIADKPKGRHKIRVRRMPAGGKGAP